MVMEKRSPKEKEGVWMAIAFESGWHPLNDDGAGFLERCAKRRRHIDDATVSVLGVVPRDEARNVAKTMSLRMVIVHSWQPGCGRRERWW